MSKRLRVFIGRWVYCFAIWVCMPSLTGAFFSITRFHEFGHWQNMVGLDTATFSLSAHDPTATTTGKPSGAAE